MSLPLIQNPELIDLSTLEQEFFTGGKSNSMLFNNMPYISSNGFPSVVNVNPFASQNQDNTQETIKSYHHNVGTVLN
jgi:hypothetical protein